MLVISRSPNQSINVYTATPNGPRMIGRIITLEARSGQVRTGFEFPDQVIFVRDEIDGFKGLQGQQAGPQPTGPQPESEPQPCN